MTFSPPANTVWIAAQICKGVNPRWCGQHCENGYFKFTIGTCRFTDGGNRLWVNIGAHSYEHFELIDQYNPRKKRKVIRSIIKDFRDYVRFNVPDVPEV